MGGLVFGENGPEGHFGSLTWDKVRGDQTIGFRHLEGETGTYESALMMWQQPDIPSDLMLAKRDSVRAIADEDRRRAAWEKLIDDELVTRRRLYLGKTRRNETLLEMLDSKGRTRIVMMVGADGQPMLEFWDEEGEAIYHIP